MTNFICITFGSDSQLATEWFNYRTNHSTAKSAERWGLNCMPIAGTFGFVVVEETEDSWKLLHELSILPSEYSVAYGDHTCSIQPAPQLTLV